jgi:hypothetical protein
MNTAGLKPDPKMYGTAYDHEYARTVAIYIVVRYSSYVATMAERITRHTVLHLLATVVGSSPSFVLNFAPICGHLSRMVHVRLSRVKYSGVAKGYSGFRTHDHDQEVQNGMPRYPLGHRSYVTAIPYYYMNCDRTGIFVITCSAIHLWVWQNPNEMHTIKCLTDSFDLVVVRIVRQVLLQYFACKPIPFLGVEKSADVMLEIRESSKVDYNGDVCRKIERPSNANAQTLKAQQGGRGGGEDQAAGSPGSDATRSRRARRVNRFKQMTHNWVD